MYELKNLVILTLPTTKQSLYPEGGKLPSPHSTSWYKNAGSKHSALSVDWVGHPRQVCEEHQQLRLAQQRIPGER